MANTLTNLIPTIYEATDIVSRELVGFIPAVQRDSNLARVAKGSTITVPIAPASAAGDVAPGVTAPNDGDQTIGNYAMTISKSRYVPIRWNGEEVLGLSAGPGVNPILAGQMAQAMRTLTNEVEVDLYTAARKGTSRGYGTAGTTPFATNGDMTDLAETLRILDDNGAPQTGRRLILGSAGVAKMRAKQQLLMKVNESGDGGSFLRDGVLGRLEGADLGYSGAVKPVAAGTGASYTSNTAGYAIGATDITLITGTGTVLAGDSVTFNGDSNIYTVATGVAAAGVIKLAAPGLRQALPASAVAMTIVAASTSNVLFTPNAYVLATRRPALPAEGDMADDRMDITDPHSGITFELSLYRQYRQVKYELALAWGVGICKSEHSAVLLG